MKRKKNKKRMFSLSYKVFLTAVAIAILPMLIVGTMLFTQSANIVKKNESAAKLNTLAHIGTNVETILQYVDDLSVLLIQDDIVRDWLKMGEEPDDAMDLKRIALQKRLSFCVGNKDYISGISIENLWGETVFVGTNRETPMKEQMKKDADQLKGRLTWVTDIEQWDGLNQSEKTISMVRAVNDMNSGKKLATMRIEILVQELSKSFADQIADKNNVTYMIDKEGDIIASEDMNILGSRAPQEILEEMNRESVRMEKTVGGQPCIVTLYQVDDSPWTLVNVVPVKYVLSDNVVLKRILTGSLLISVILCVGCAYLFSRICTKPLVELTGRLKVMDMKHIEMMPSNDEVGVLVDTYNNMSGYIDKLADELARKKIELKEAEFAALQAQINPHSLYNNLDTAYWLSRLEEAPKTGEIILAMSRLYRLSLGNVNEIVTVGEELDYLDNYLVIQKIRLEDTVHFQFEVDEETRQCRTLRFILQPIVENSILHGMIPKDAEGTIRIRIYKENQELIVRVSDDGVGADCARLNEILLENEDDSAGKSCFAIKNVNNRIQLRFGERYGLHYETDERGWTTAMIRQPGFL